MKSIISLKLILLLFFFSLIFLGLLLFGFFMVIKAIFVFDLTGVLTGLLLIWFCLGLFLLIKGKLKIIKVDSDIITIRNLLGFKIKTYRLSEVLYEEFEFETIYGKTRGILIKLDSIISISNSEYSNSDLIIKYIKDKCYKGNGLKVEIWNKELKVFIIIGLLILLLLFLC